MREELKGKIFVVLACALTGLFAILVRLGKDLGGYNLAFFRVFLTAFFILLFSFFFKKFSLKSFKFERKKMILFGIITAIHISFFYLSFFYISIAAATLLATATIWVILLSRIMLKEKIKPKTLQGLILGLIGLALLFYPKGGFVIDSLIGSLLALLSAIGIAFVYILSKTFKTYDKISLTFWQHVFATIALVIFLFIFPPKITASNIWIILLIGIVATAAFILFFEGFARIKGQQGGVLLLTFPIFGIIYAMLFFKEVPNYLTWIAAVLIIGGTYIANKNN